MRGRRLGLDWTRAAEAGMGQEVVTLLLLLLEAVLLHLRVQTVPLLFRHATKLYS